MQWYEILAIVGGTVGPIVVAVIAAITANNKNFFNVRETIKDSQITLKDSIISTKDLIKTNQDNQKTQLSCEHREILNKQTDIFNIVITDKEKREQRDQYFNETQKDTYRKVDEINAFLHDWQRLILENSQLKIELNKYRERFGML